MDNLRKFMDSSIEKLGLPGIDCIVYRNHEEIFRHMSGYSEPETKTPVKPDAIYHIYSATKVITCTAVLQLVEQGKLLLGDLLSDYLPAFGQMQFRRGSRAFYPAQKAIRIVDLLSMTAGISYDVNTPSTQALLRERGQDFNTEEFVNTLAKEPLLFEPGDNWHYGLCHDILAVVIEKITNMTFGEYLKANIFDPLGMKDTGFFIPEEKLSRRAPLYSFDSRSEAVERVALTRPRAVAGDRREGGGGGLISTTEDYILFADALACGGIGKTGARILSPASIRLMSSNRLSGAALNSFQMMQGPGMGYGLGVGVYDDPVSAGTLVPKGSFFWGGLGGVQDLIDPQNGVSYFVAQHVKNSPKHKLMPYMLNILYSYL